MAEEKRREIYVKECIIVRVGMIQIGAFGKLLGKSDEDVGLTSFCTSFLV